MTVSDVAAKLKQLNQVPPAHLTFNGIRLWFNETFGCEIENDTVTAVAKAMLGVLQAQKPAKKGETK